MRLFCSFISLEAPVVQRSSFLKFQRADGLGDAFDGVRQRMREIVERINAPFIAGAVMGGMEDAVNNRISHNHIRRRHVDFRTEHLLAVRILAVLHFLEELQVFLDTSISIRTLNARMTQVAAGIVDFLARLVIHIGEAHANQAAGEFIKFREIVGREMHRFLPLEAQPLHIFQNGIHILHFFFRRVRIIKTHIRGAVIFLAQAEIQTNALHVTDVQIAIRFRRETGQHLVIGIDMVLKVFIDFRFNKISGGSLFFHSSSSLIYVTG